MKTSRKLIICKSCNKEKTHFGLRMCSPCLRHWKRQNRPVFYLQTQYSEMKRRCTKRNYGGRNYQGKILCTKQEFINKFKDNQQFLNQYRIWQQSGYKRGDSPSIDRIDNKGGYDLNNLQILQHRLNGPKDSANKIVLSTETHNITFKSQKEVAKYLNVHDATVSMILNGHRPNTLGVELYRVKK